MALRQCRPRSQSLESFLKKYSGRIMGCVCICDLGSRESGLMTLLSTMIWFMAKLWIRNRIKARRTMNFSISSTFLSRANYLLTCLNRSPERCVFMAKLTLSASSSFSLFYYFRGPDVFVFAVAPGRFIYVPAVIFLKNNLFFRNSRTRRSPTCARTRRPLLSAAR